MKILSLFCELLLKVYLAAQRPFLKFCLHFARPENDKLLKKYLLLDHETRNSFINATAVNLFNGFHPKNVYNYRSEFFENNVDTDDVVIDIACGTGSILNIISDKIKKGYGLENNPSNLKLCNKNKNENIKFIEADIFNFNYTEFKQDKKYTCAVFSHILEHIEDPVNMISNVNAEKVLICVPSQENWLTQLKIHLNLPYLTDSTHFREYTRVQLTNELKTIGYQADYIGFNAEGEIICKAYRK